MRAVASSHSIGIALSGGGVRAIAFHLGCLRAIEACRLLPRVSVISAVSGGAVLAAMYAYFDESFASFEERVISLLSQGLQGKILRHCLSPKLLARITLTNAVSRPAALASGLFDRNPPFRRWASRTDALEAALGEILPDGLISQVARPGLDIVLNACELSTGSAFRFGNQTSGSWRFGSIEGNAVSIKHAVTCSSAHPVFFPAIDRQFRFSKNDGDLQTKRVVLTDGGVYDNLGLSCLEPGRDRRISSHVYDLDYIICCNAGHGQFSGARIPYGFMSRTGASFESIFRKLQDASMHRLHQLKDSGQIRGFVLAYLGQMDHVLRARPQGFVSREEVFGSPTNFRAMDEYSIKKLALRGEQLTRMLLFQYLPELCE